MAKILTVRDAGGQTSGFLFVFNYQGGANVKNNDPQKDNSNLIYMSANGKKLLDLDFKMKRSASYYYALEKENQLLVFAKAEKMDFGIYQIDKDEMKFIPLSTISSVGAVLPLKFYTTPYIQSHIVLPDSSYILFGNRIDSDTEDNITHYYMNYMFLHFNKENVLLTHYAYNAIGMDGANDFIEIHYLTGKDQKLYFMAEEYQGENTEKTYTKFLSSAKDTVQKDNRRYLYMPTIVSLDLNNKDIDVTKVSRHDFVIANPESYYVFDEKKRVIYFAGYDKKSEDLPVKIIVSKVKLEE